MYYLDKIPVRIVAAYCAKWHAATFHAIARKCLKTTFWKEGEVISEMYCGTRKEKKSGGKDKLC